MIPTPNATALAAALAAAALVSACVASPPKPVPVASSAAPADRIDSAPPVAVIEAAPVTALAPAPVPVRPRLKPAELEGSVRARVTTLLGDPDFRRDDPPAQLMQYRGTRCIFDVFLYADAAGGPHRVAHVETRSRSVARVSGEECLASLLRERGRDEPEERG